MTFFNKYSLFYDTLYSDKNYEVECDYLEEIFREYSNEAIRSLCDTGCGSGGFSIPLAKRGYDVLGIDLSENMISKAREKSNNGSNPRFRVMDLREMKLDTEFDAVLSMFAVMGYITENRELKQVFKNVHNHLKPGGLYIFDVWNGLAVLRDLPENRKKEVETSDDRIIRFATPALKSHKHICEVDYQVFKMNKKSQTVEEIFEKHVMRFFFPQEINYYLEEAGFDVLNICPLMDLKGTVNENTWNMLVVSQKR